MGNNINPEKINSSAPSLLRHVQSTPLFQQHQFINDAPPDHEEIGLMGSSTQSNAHPYNDNHEQDDDVACFTDSTASINNIRKRSQTLGLNRRTSSSRHLKQPSLSDSSSSPIMPISPNNNNQLYGNPSSSPFPTSSTPISIPTSTTRNDDPNSPNVLSASSVLATSFSSSSPNVQRTTEHQINAALSSSSPNNTPKQQFSTKRNIPLLNLPPRPTSLSSNASPRHHHNEPRYSSWVGTSPKQAHLNPIESAAITASNCSVSVSNVMMMSNNNTITSDETSKDGLSRIIYMNRNGNNNFQLDASPKNSSPSYSPQLWTNTSLFKQTSNNLQQEPVAIIISKSTPISPHHNDERNAKLSRKANSNKSSLGSTSSSKSGGRTNRSHSTALLTPRGVNMLSPRGVNGIPYSPRGSLSPRTNFTRPTNGAASTTPTTSNNGNHNQRSYPISFDDVTENDIHGEENDSDLEDMNISEISTNHNPKNYVPKLNLGKMEQQPKKRRTKSLFDKIPTMITKLRRKKKSSSSKTPTSPDEAITSQMMNTNSLISNPSTYTMQTIGGDTEKKQRSSPKSSEKSQNIPLKRTPAMNVSSSFRLSIIEGRSGISAKFEESEDTFDNISTCHSVYSNASVPMIGRPTKLEISSSADTPDLTSNSQVVIASSEVLEKKKSRLKGFLNIFTKRKEKTPATPNSSQDMAKVSSVDEMSQMCSYEEPKLTRAAREDSSDSEAMLVTAEKEIEFGLSVSNLTPKILRREIERLDARGEAVRGIIEFITEKISVDEAEKFAEKYKSLMHISDDHPLSSLFKETLLHHYDSDRLKSALTKMNEHFYSSSIDLRKTANAAENSSVTPLVLIWIQIQLFHYIDQIRFFPLQFKCIPMYVVEFMEAVIRFNYDCYPETCEIPRMRPYFGEEDEIMEDTRIIDETELIRVCSLFATEVMKTNAARTLCTLHEAHKTRTRLSSLYSLSINFSAIGHGAKCRMNAALQKFSISIMQARIRGRLTFSSLKENMSRITTLQSLIRQANQRQQLYLSKQLVIYLQSNSRKILIRSSTENMIYQITILQSLLRGNSRRQEVFAQLEKIRKIQALINAKYTTSIFRRNLNNVKTIQCMALKSIATGNCCSNFKKIQKIQAVARGVIRREQSNSMRHNITGPIVTIQAVIRAQNQRRGISGLLEQSNVIIAFFKGAIHRNVLSVERSHSLSLQAVSRKALSERNFTLTKQVASQLQTALRGLFQRRDYSAEKNSVLILQAKFKSRLATTELEMHNSCIVKLQLVAKQYFIQREKRESIQRLELFQAAVRRFMIRRTFVSCQQQSTAITCLSRGVIARNQYFKNVNSIHTLQAKVRGTTFHNKHMDMVGSAVSIQSFLIGSRSYTKFQHITNSVLLLQASLKGSCHRDRVHQDVNSVKALQSNMKSKLVRAEHESKQQQLRILQAVIRRHLTAKSMHTQLSFLQTIQIVAKSYLTGQHHTTLVKTASFLSSMAQGHQSRRLHHVSLNQILIMQAKSRSYIQKLDCLHRFQQIHVVGAIVLSHLSKKRMNEAKQSSFLIMAVLRGFSTRKHYDRSWTAIHKIQQVYQHERIVSNFSLEKRRILILQALTRSFIAKPRLNNCQNKIPTLQAVILGKITRKEIKEKNSSTKNIQQVIRGFNARTQYKQQMNSVLTIQSAARKKKQVNTLRHYHHEILCVQASIRGFEQRKAFRIFVDKTVCLVQAASRAKIVRTNNEHIHNSIILLQALCRGLLQRKQFIETKESLSIIDDTLQAYKQRTGYLKYLSAIHILQASARSALDKKNIFNSIPQLIYLQAFLKGSTHRKNHFIDLERLTQLQNFIRITNAQKLKTVEVDTITQVQAFVRRKREQIYLSHFKNSIIHVQALIRSKLAIYQIIQHVSRVKLIQSLIRSRFSKLSLAKEYSARTLQALQRAFTTRSQTIREFNTIEIFQAMLQGIVCRKNFLLLRDNTQTIQAYAKSSLVQHSFNSLCSSIVAIKGFLGSALQRKVFKSQLQRIWTLQALFLSSIERKRFHDDQSNVIVIQSTITGHMERQQIESRLQLANLLSAMARSIPYTRNFKQTKRVTIQMQAFARSRLSKPALKSLKHITLLQAISRRYLENKKQDKYAVMKALTDGSIVRNNLKKDLCRIEQIQALVKGNLELSFMKKSIQAVRTLTALSVAIVERTRFVQVTDQITKLHTAARATLCTHQFKKDLERVQTLQAVIRRSQCARKYQTQLGLLEKLHSWSQQKVAWARKEKDLNSIAFIQAMTRKHYAISQKAVNLNAIVNIQAVAQRLTVQKSLKDHVTSITSGQAMFRSAHIRLESDKVKHSMTVVQASMSGYAARRNFLMNKCGLLVQALVKGNTERKVFAVQMQAIIFIQSRIAGHRLRTNMKLQLCSNEQLQSLVRRYQCCKEFHVERNRAQLLSALLKAAVERTHMTSVLDKLAVIQAFLRRRLTMIQSHSLMRQVSEIEAIYHGHLDRKKYENMKGHVITVQSMMRALIASKEKGNQLQMLTKLQCLSRLYLCRKHLVKTKVTISIMKRTEVSWIVQASMRGFIARKEFRTLLSKKTTLVECMNALMKRKSIQCKFESMKNSCSKLQAKVRQLHAVKNCQAQVLSIQLIQALATKSSTCKKHMEYMDHLTLIQAAMISCHERKHNFALLQQATLMMESVVKGNLVRQNLHKLQDHVLIIQSRDRKLNCKRHFIAETNRIHVLQAIARSFIARNQHAIAVGQTRTVITLQALLRGIQQRNQEMRSVKECPSKLLLVQAVARNILARHQLTQLKIQLKEKFSLVRQFKMDDRKSGLALLSSISLLNKK